MPLRLDWCSFTAAQYACRHWHYSRSMPAGKTVKVGVWEDDQFIGAVIFAWGSNQHLGKTYGLKMEECCELCRVALKPGHRCQVTRVLRIALKYLAQHSPGLRLVVSYADRDQNHHGGIYAGGNWIYTGRVQLNGGTPKYKIRGKVMHGRSVAARGWKQQISWIRQHVDAHAERIYTLGKEKYLFPLDDAMRAQVIPLMQPYPKRLLRAGSIDSDASCIQQEEGGASPTSALHSPPRKSAG
jgi:hypothetical protein